MHLKPQQAKKISAFLASVFFVSVTVGASMAFASLTFTNNNVTGDSGVVIDASGPIAIGTSTATGITIGAPSNVTTFPGAVAIQSSGSFLLGTSTLPSNALFAIATSSNIFTVLSNGNVGIGTTTPSSSLTISTVGSPANLPLSIIGDPGQSTDILHLYKGSTLLASLDNGGSLRIANRLQLIENGTTSTLVQALYSESGTNNLLLRAGPIANRIVIKDSGLQTIANFIGGVHTFAVGSSFNGPTSTDPVDGMIVQGHVGIGTQTPSTTLQVAGASSTVLIGAGSIAGCLELMDSSGNGTINYLTATGGALSATTTKPSTCQ